MRDHVLQALAMPAKAPGSIRRAEEGDRDWLVAMQRAFAAEARVRMSEPALAAHVAERLAGGRYRIWHDGKDVAFAGFALAGEGAARVAPVYTLPAFRARGYAGSLVASICAELLEDGRQVFLVTDVDNPTANALYARLGFVALGDHYAYEIGGES
jgi:predicted GNAT family acetyltransferase